MSSLLKRFLGRFFFFFSLLSSEEATGFSFGSSILPRTLSPFNVSALASIIFLSGFSPVASSFSSAGASEAGCSTSAGASSLVSCASAGSSAGFSGSFSAAGSFSFFSGLFFLPSRSILPTTLFPCSFGDSVGTSSSFVSAALGSGVDVSSFWSSWLSFIRISSSLSLRLDT